MDIVITYVDGLDPQWRKAYADTVGGEPLVKRFRDWGTLKYLLRGIERFMPDAGNVFLVVSSASQVPSWVDASKVTVVLHEQIIPEQYLPVFNSTAIEMFLHRIPGLGEQFVYFNDDTFPVSLCKASDLFDAGHAVVRFRKGRSKSGAYRQNVVASHDFARRAAGLGPTRHYLRPQHAPTPMLRSVSEELFEARKTEILKTVTPLRQGFNLNQYVFTCYSLYTGRTVEGKGSCKHFSLGLHPAGMICRWLAHPDRRCVSVPTWTAE